MLEHHNMFKQLQERQMQQQCQELGDARQQLNYVGQQSMMNKHALTPQFPSFSNLLPSQDSSNMFPAQGFSNALAFSRTEPLATSSYGTSVPSGQNLDALDPLEQKILFNTDDNNCLGNTDNLGDFSSLQSGSWSALMQSAVAETTSSDPGLQEEWSSLSYQNPDPSNITRPLNFVDRVSQKHSSWADDNANSCFSGLHQSGEQISFKQKDGFHKEMTHKSFQQSPENGSNWMDCSVSSFINPNVTGEPSRHMHDLVHKANKPMVSSTSSGTSIVSSTRSQFQSQHESGQPVPLESPQEAFAAKGCRFSEFTAASSQNCTNLLDGQMPFLGTNSPDQLSVTSGLSYTMSPPDAWTNMPSQIFLPDLKPQVKLEFEAFGCSLKPSDFSPQNYSLMNQINPVKNEKTDLSRASEKHSGVYFDSNNQPHPLEGLSQRDGSQCNFTTDNLAFNRTEQSKISLQMANTWFNHYGTLKNEQSGSMHEPKAPMNTTKQFFVGKPHGNLNSSVMQVKSVIVSQVNSSLTTSTDSVAVTDLVVPHILSPKVTEPKLGALRPNKRKIGPFDLLPWHKSVTQRSQGLQFISTAELEWAKSVNRLVEKVADEAQIVEAIHRPKKRLVFTTQLMQQLFQPVPSVFLLGDATKNCASAAYFAARLALEDACSLTSNSVTPCVSDMSFEKHNFPWRNSNHDIRKSVEDILNRSKQLEEELLSLENKVSISDIRVESQELEKFSLVNRLAKYHSRGARGATKTSTASSPNVNTQKVFLQRYVKAHPMPKTVPEGAKCSLLS